MQTTTHPIATALLTAAVILTAAPAAQAEPYMAVRGGFSCGDCHVNRSGGGMRTLTAEMHAVDILSLPNDGMGILPAHDDWFSPNVSDFFSIGADVRLVDKVTFKDDPVYADSNDTVGSVKNNTAFRSLDSNDMDLAQATIYAHLRLIPEVLSVYIDEDLSPGGGSSAENREAFILLDKVLPNDAYIKAGRFFPAWGLKLQDDESFAGSVAGFTFNRTVAGLELGRSGEGLNWFVSVSESTEDDDTDQLLVASAYRMWPEVGPFANLMAGASAAHDKPNSNEALWLTAFGGASVGRWTLLAQSTFVDSETSGETTKSWAASGEANYLWQDWINTKVVFDFYDPDDDQAEDARNRVSLGIEPFIDRFLQLRVFYRVLNGPENQPQYNRDELTLEAHLFF